jgi:hypothetical protein
MCTDKVVVIIEALDVDGKWKKKHLCNKHFIVGVKNISEIISK